MRWIRAGETALDADRIVGFAIDTIDIGWGPEPAFDYAVVAILDTGYRILLERFQVMIGPAAEYKAQLERELADHKAGVDRAKPPLPPLQPGERFG